MSELGIAAGLVLMVLAGVSKFREWRRQRRSNKIAWEVTSGIRRRLR